MEGDNSDFVEQFKRKCVCTHLERMQQELNQLKGNPDYKLSAKNLGEFNKLFKRYLNLRDDKLDWNQIDIPPSDKILNYSDLLTPDVESKKELLSKLAVLKLNGGLGTTMGCTGPKSAIQVRNGKNFIDLVVKQISHLNKKYDLSVPLLLMNSFTTEKVTQKIIYKYENIRTFEQSIFPRISVDTLLPVADNVGDAAFYPPGHGDLIYSLHSTGMLDQLIEEGREYLFVSNIDNLAATVDLKILDLIASNNIDFCMEVTPKTRADIKGGTLIQYKDSLRLLEIAQVPPEHIKDFTNSKKFQVFNTNSVWINLVVLKKIIDEQGIELDIIENKKTIKSTGEKVIQLETAIGAAIRFFPNACGLVVPRSRFLPVKTCSDLFLVESNLYLEDHGALRLNPKRLYGTSPLVKLLGSNFNILENFKTNIKSIPDILELDHLTVSGDVKFGRNVVLRGTVIIIADEKSSISIPDGSILDNNILYGNLPIIEH